MQKSWMVALGLAMGLIFGTQAMAEHGVERRGGDNIKVLRAAQAVKSDATQLSRALKYDYAPSAVIKAADKVAWEAKEVIDAARYSRYGSNGRVLSAVSRLQGRFGILERAFYRYGNSCSYQTERLFSDLKWSIAHLEDVAYGHRYPDYPDYPTRPGRPGRGGIGGRTVIFN